jgi:hypothetical protein
MVFDLGALIILSIWIFNLIIVFRSKRVKAATDAPYLGFEISKGGRC